MVSRKRISLQRGIAGYTLISNSHGFVLAAHEPLESAQAAVERELDIHSSRRVVERVGVRTLVADTDTGREAQGSRCRFGAFA